MKLTNGEVWMAKPQLDKLVELELPLKTSLELFKLSKKINEEFIPINQTNQGLIKKHGTVDKDNPKTIGIKPGDANWSDYMEEFAELMSLEIEVDVEKVEVKLPEPKEGETIKAKAFIILGNLVGVS